MRKRTPIRAGALGATALVTGALALAACGGSGSGQASTSSSASSNPTFSNPTKVTNPNLPLSKFDSCTLTGNVNGTQTRVVRTNLSRTKTIHWSGGTVDALVQRDQEKDNGKLAERTFDYFAQSDAGDVYYLGEDVNEYNNHGQVKGHGGAWLLGRDTQTPGLLMPANPKLGDKFTSEDVPGITHEDDTVVPSKNKAKVRGRTYNHVFKIREDTSPKPETEFKLYSKGTGVITEENGQLKLDRCS
jgi:hypothetical protein